MDESAIEFGPCVTNPEKILCLGFNYRKHAIETNTPIPTSPVLFTKCNNALLGHNGVIKLPTHVATKFDHEVELVVVCFLAASHLVGQGEKADQVLRAMLGRQQGQGFQNGVQNATDKGIDWTTWDGKPCGYEGFLADVFYFLLAVVLREPSLRERYYKPFTTA